MKELTTQLRVCDLETDVQLERRGDRLLHEILYAHQTHHHLCDASIRDARTCEQIKLLSPTHPRSENDLARAHGAVLAIAEDEGAGGKRLVAVRVPFATMVFLEDLSGADGDKLARSRGFCLRPARRGGLGGHSRRAEEDVD